MKRTLIILTLCLTCFLSIISLSACGCDCGKTHEHDFGDWQITTPATCETDGEETRVCKTDSTHKETRKISALGHTAGEWEVVTKVTCTEKGLRQKKCTVCNKVIEREDINALGHTIVDGECTVCGYLVPTDSEYFTFMLLSNGTYEIKAKDVNNMPAEVILPAEYKGKAVTSIGELAFYNCDSLTSITIPDRETCSWGITKTNQNIINKSEITASSF